MEAVSSPGLTDIMAHLMPTGSLAAPLSPNCNMHYRTGAAILTTPSWVPAHCGRSPCFSGQPRPAASGTTPTQHYAHGRTASAGAPIAPMVNAPMVNAAMPIAPVPAPAPAPAVSSGASDFRSVVDSELMKGAIAAAVEAEAHGIGLMHGAGQLIAGNTVHAGNGIPDVGADGADDITTGQVVSKFTVATGLLVSC